MPLFRHLSRALLAYLEYYYLASFTYQQMSSKTHSLTPDDVRAIQITDNLNRELQRQRSDNVESTLLRLIHHFFLRIRYPGLLGGVGVAGRK